MKPGWLLPANTDYKQIDPQIAWHPSRFIEELRTIPSEPMLHRLNISDKIGAIAANAEGFNLKIRLSRIHYFYTSYKLGSMRAASDLLNVAPSSISRQISLLENEVGLPLIERGRRSIKLTEAGETVVNYYREELALEEAFQENIENLRGQRSGHIRVAMGEAFVSHSLAGIISDFIVKHPGIQITVDVSSTTDLMRMVSEDEVHFGMTFEAAPEPRLSRRLSLQAPIQLLVAPSHPLVGRKSVSLKDLSTELLALPAPGFRIRQVLQEAELKEGVHLNPHFISNSLALIKDFACSGKGVAVLPKVAAIGELTSGELLAIPIESRVLSETSINVMIRRGRQLPIAIVTFMNIICSNLSRWTGSSEITKVR